MKEYIVEAVINGAELALALDVPDDVVDGGQKEIVKYVLAQPFLMDTEGMITTFPHKFDMMAVYPLLKKPSLVDVTSLGEDDV